jgi:hypothetical protein
MCKKTWCAVKASKWKKTKKIRSLSRTIFTNICNSNKEKFDLNTEINNLKLEMQAIRGSD